MKSYRTKRVMNYISLLAVPAVYFMVRSVHLLWKEKRQERALAEQWERSRAKEKQSKRLFEICRNPDTGEEVYLE